MFAAVLFAASFQPPVAPPPREKADPVRAAVARALPLLAAGAEGHAEQKTCFACHNQAFPVMALAAARDRGFDVAGGSFAAQAEHISRFLIDNNFNYTKMLAEWALQHGIRFVYASSAATYGALEGRLSEDLDIASLRSWSEVVRSLRRPSMRNDRGGTGMRPCGGWSGFTSGSGISSGTCVIGSVIQTV